MKYLAVKGAHSVKVESDELTPDDLQHLSPDELFLAITEDRFYKAMGPLDGPTCYVIPYGAGAYTVLVSLAKVTNVIYSSSFDIAAGLFDAAYEREPETTVLIEGKG